MKVVKTSRFALVIGALLWVSLMVASPSSSADSCRVWKAEQRAASEKVLGLYLSDAPGEALDRAMFDLLQREAYLTACPLSVEFARDHLVGWRLVGRPRNEFAVAVIDSLLGRAGYDVELAELLDRGTSVVAARTHDKGRGAARQRRP